jgi:hypothetical protein
MATAFTLDPQMLALISLLQGTVITGGGTPTASATGTGAQLTSAQLQSFIDAIPFANDGDVITPEHHNSLRVACARIAQSLDETQLARVVTESSTPVLLAAGAEPAWRTAVGFAAGPTTGNKAEGWMPVELPNATNVDALTVRGKRPAAVTIWSAALRRVELTGSTQADVCAGEIQSATTSGDGSFAATVPAKTEGLSATQAAELRRVDNTRYRYFFHTKVSGATQADALEVRLVQVTCTRG